MKTLFLILVLLLSSCTHRLNIHYYSEGEGKNLEWTKETKKLASPNMNNTKIKRDYDSSIFKLKHEVEAAPSN